MPTHAEKRVVPYRPEQMYELVRDVERYPEFLPWCLACRIKRRPSENELVSDMVIGFKMFREKFTTRVKCHPEAHRLDVSYEDGPFRYLQNHWVFEEHPDGCLIDFYVDFEFRSRLLQRAIGAVFNEAVKRMIQAFESRADALYG